MKYTQSFCFVSVIVLSSSVHLHGQNNKMNVLLIIADDMRPELGCYGIEDIVTPRLDSLARYATVFQRGFQGKSVYRNVSSLPESFYCV